MAYMTKNSNNRYNQNNRYNPNNGYNRNNNASSQNEIATAPYNFVSFCDKPYEYGTNMPKHSDMNEELLSGEISYKITAETPIMVGSGKGEVEEFYRNGYNRCAIPGSTMRGLIRNNVQVLGLANYGDDIEDGKLMYRAVAGGNRKEYSKILGSSSQYINGQQITILGNVRAGYIKKREGKYVIYKLKGDEAHKKGMPNYYVLSARDIRDKKVYPFFAEYPERSISNNNYKPYFERILYKATDEKVTFVKKYGDKNGEDEKAGYILSSGKVNKKHAMYIIPEIDLGEYFIIKDDNIKAYMADYKRRETTLKNKEFYKLPEEGEEPRPVFYIEHDGRQYFGFTPTLRIFYNKTIKDCFKQAPVDCDYAKALFGYSDGSCAYKTRVSFTDATLEGVINTQGKVQLALESPKPTANGMYLKKKGDTDNITSVTYNTNDAVLRGAKHYWLHSDVVNYEGGRGTKMRPLKEGSVFIGKVRFKNLRTDELGLLLWSIKLEQGSRMNVGKGKPYGYGKIKVDILGAKSVDLTKAYSTDMGLQLEPMEELEVEKYIKIYKEYISGEVKQNIEQVSSVKEFLAMKGSSLPKEKVAYMEVGTFKNKILPTVTDVLKQKRR